MAKSLVNIPSFLRNALEGNRSIILTGADIGSNNYASTSSFIYDSIEVPLKSTQQLNVDWENFEEHTFFSPATINVNSAFDRIINGYPFDGTRVELERFIENLTGYEYWILQQFPKYRGQLRFDKSVGNYITVYDSPGYLFSDLAKDTNDGMRVISPKEGESMTIEFQYCPQTGANGNQFLCQMSRPDPSGEIGFGLAIRSSIAGSSTQILTALVTSGSYQLIASGPMTKGTFNHVVVTYDNRLSTGNQVLGVTIGSGSTTWSTNSTTAIGSLDAQGYPLYIGSGSTITIPSPPYTAAPDETLDGVLDEFRIFKTVRSPYDLENYQARSVFAQDDLTLYFRFNEPPPPLVSVASPSLTSMDAIVLDSSGNSLHSIVSNFTGSLRINASGSIYGDPMYLEREFLNPILFPAQQDVVDLNGRLLTSASNYDLENPNIITRLVPSHYFYEGQSNQGLSTVDGTITDTYVGSSIPGTGKLGSSQLFMSLLYVYARFFDEIKMYIDAFSKVQYVDYDRSGTVPDTFLQGLLIKYGFVIPPIFSNSSIEQYVDAENVQYPASAGTNSLKYVQNELLRRLLVNLPNIIKSKGTQYSIKAFLRSLGIDPENSCRIREYGGPSQQVLGSARDSKTLVGSMTTFTTSTLVLSPYLYSARKEVGYPQTQGSMISKDMYPPHGTSSVLSDGYLTSGSFTVETIIRFPLNRIGSLTGRDSIVRLCTTGSLISTSSLLLAANLVATSGTLNTDPYLTLYVRPDSVLFAPILELNLTGVNVYDSDTWNVSFGRIRGDDPSYSIQSSVSSSYFLKAAKTSEGRLSTYCVTSSLLGHASGSVGKCVFEQYDSVYNASGTFLAVGQNQTFSSLYGISYRMLNNAVTASVAAREVSFSGQMSNLRFWSKALSDNEWKEHVKNFKSVGTINPLVNYNFTHTPSGSFERLRIDSLAKQDTTDTDSHGNITFIDYTGNDFHMTGSGYSANSTVIVPQLYNISYISPSFDEPTTNDKVRPRGFFSQENIDEFPGSSLAPVYELDPSETPQDDTRLSVEFSLIDALNRDIITIFSTLESLDSALGDPTLMYSPDYPDIERLRDIYFNRLTSKLNFKAFNEFFKFFDMSIATFIEQLVPKKTKFMGVNVVIESHMLERHKLEYFSNNMYLGEFDRLNLNHSLLLQQIVGVLKKY